MDDEALHRLSELQHNVVARRQAAELGFDRWAIAHRLRRGEWTAATPRVLRRSGAAPDPYEPVMTALLHAGDDAVASHETAAWLWSVPGFHRGAAQVIRSRASTNGTHPHRPRLLLPHHVTEVQGIPVTSLPVTLFHLAGVASVSPARIERAVATVVGRAPSLLAVLDQTLEELATPGRPGIRAMRAILAAQDRSGVKLTGLERRFEHILRHAGQPPLDRQVDVGGHAWIGRVDYLDRHLRLLVEVDSITFHSSHADRLRDAARDAALLAAGFRKVVRVAEEWIWYQPELAVAAVRDARAELRRVAA